MRLLKIGRDASCDIVLHSDRVSSFHAEITLTNSGDILLEDKGSSNGTYIMNQAIAPGKPVTIRRGDPVKLADVDLPWDRVPMPEDNSAYKAVYGIGSHTNNDIKISGGTVSRYHATIKVGKDNKVYIIDHSKNGTTVDGRKIQSNVPVQIKKNNVIVCGGVPLNLANSPVKWPAFEWKKIAIAAACIILLCGVGSAIYDMAGEGGQKEYDDGELYAMYNNAVVYLEATYHFRVTGIPKEKLAEYGMDSDFYVDGNGTIIPVEAANIKPTYSGTGFFVSKDGMIITNLHMVKPWLYSNIQEQAQELYKRKFAAILAARNAMTNNVYSAQTGDDAYITQIKIEGVLDGLVFVPQGKYYSISNAIYCRVLSAGNDPSEDDVALIQSDRAEVPAGSRYLNLADSMDMSNETLKVGQHVYTIGFPEGQNSLLQKSNNEKGIQVIAQGGSIIQQDSEIEFGYNAPTSGGASGSPVFNKYGMLIGVHHAGLSKVSTQGYNYAVKAKYIYNIINSPHRVK